MSALDLAADSYFDALARVDQPAATTHVLELLDEGTPLQSIITNVLIPAQVRVGELWASGAWGVADEHAATAVTETALSALVTAASRRTRATDTRAPHVLVACAEGEWHALPARMTGAAALDTGARVTFLGASMSAEHLGRRMRAGDVDVLALSCTLPPNLLGAARCVQAAHEAGVPVVAGGRAFAGRAQRADAIGADALASSLGALGVSPPALVGRTVDLPTEAFVLDATGSATIEIAYGRMISMFPRLAAMSPWQQSRTREDLQWMARFAGAAVLTGDATVLPDFLGWLARLLDGKVPAAVIAASAGLLADAIEPDAPTGAQLLRQAAQLMDRSA